MLYTKNQFNTYKLTLKIFATGNRFITKLYFVHNLDVLELH